MTEEERIAYYKAKYGFVPTAAAQAKAKADDSVKAQNKTSATKASDSMVSASKLEAPKSENKLVKFFKKLFGSKK